MPLKAIRGCALYGWSNFVHGLWKWCGQIMDICFKTALVVMGGWSINFEHIISIYFDWEGRGASYSE